MILDPPLWLAQYRCKEPVSRLAAGHSPHDSEDGCARTFDYVLIFFALERAGGINQPSPEGELREPVAQNGDLATLQVGNIGGFQTPFDLRIARQRARAGAGGVDQYAIEFAGERQRLCGVQRDYGDAQRKQQPGAARMQIGRNRVDSGFKSLRRLVAGRGAEIEKGAARLQIEQRHNGLRTDILEAENARIAGGELVAAWNIRGFSGIRGSSVADPNVALRR